MIVTAQQIAIVTVTIVASNSINTFLTATGNIQIALIDVWIVNNENLRKTLLTSTENTANVSWLTQAEETSNCISANMVAIAIVIEAFIGIWNGPND